MESPKIDVDKVLREKNPKVYQFTPTIFLKKLRSIIHQEEINEILHKLECSENPEETGEEICIDLIEKIMSLPCIDGVHLMGPNCEKGSAQVISNFK